MISKKMQKALNDQLNFELYSAYVYASMGAYFENINLPGFAHWVVVQAKEEVGHAMKFYKFLNEVKGRVVLDTIAKPSTDFASPLAVFEEVLKHEKTVTGRIYKLVDLARTESDHATEVFLNWFVTEQVEEEAAADDVVQKLLMIGKDTRGLFLADRHLAARPSD